MQKKIAVAFFGIPRASQICGPSIDENILNRLADTGAQVKVFYHLFDLAHISNARSSEDLALDKSNYDYFKHYEGELEAPGSCLETWNFDKIKKYGDPWGDDYRSLSNLFHQLHSLHKVTQRLADFDPDVVAFVRPDLLYHDKIRKEDIVRCEKSPNSVILPNWQWWGGYNDRFALCGKSAYRIYGERISNIAKYCQMNNAPLHAEKFLQHSLDEYKCSIVPTKLRASRIRVTNYAVQENFNPVRTAGSISSLLNLISKEVLSRLKS